MREVRVFDDGEAGEKECYDDRADTNRVDRCLLQLSAEKEHDRGPEGREERDELNVV